MDFNNLPAEDNAAFWNILPFMIAPCTFMGMAEHFPSNNSPSGLRERPLNPSKAQVRLLPHSATKNWKPFLGDEWGIPVSRFRMHHPDSYSHFRSGVKLHLSQHLVGNPVQLFFTGFIFGKFDGAMNGGKRRAILQQD
jgi:hypothetical protein